MKHAYLIMAHNEWEMLRALLEALDDSRNDIYLHIDKKAVLSQQDLNQIERCLKKSKLYFTKRHNIVWGGTQMMKCMLSMLEHAVRGEYSYYHFVSGVDFPLKSQDEMHRFFSDHSGKQYVGFDWDGINSGRFLARTRYWHFFINIIGKRNRKGILYRVLERAEDILLAIQYKLHIDRNKCPVYKGSSWFSITHECASSVVEKKKEISRRFSFTANSDECWLQTFVMNSKYADCVAESNGRYIKWIQGNDSPEILTVNDYEDLIRSDKLFARKFSWSVDQEIILKLREHIRG